MNEFFGLVTPTSKNEVPNQLHNPVKICVVFLIKKKLWFWAIMGFQRIRETVSQKKKKIPNKRNCRIDGEAVQTTA